MVARRARRARQGRSDRALSAYTEADGERGAVDMTAIVRAIQAGVRLAPPAPTPREMAVITRLADDLDTDAIAEQLTISRHTVRSHLENLRLKYQKRSMAGLVALALRQGWIT